MNKKQALRIFYCGFPRHFDYKKDGLFYPILREKYDIIIDEKNPDYVIFSCFDNEHLRFNAIKIFVSGENVGADFNLG